MMLALETASHTYRVALGDETRVVASHAAEGELGDVVAEALKRGSVAPRQIATLAVNVGPGGLGVIRDGLAFISGFAVGIRAPVYTFDTVELLGHEAQAKGGALPVLCICRARRDTMLSGVFERGRGSNVRHHSLPKFHEYLDAFAGPALLAGNMRTIAFERTNAQRFTDSGIDYPQAETMLRLGVAGRRAIDPAAEPIAPITPELEE